MVDVINGNTLLILIADGALLMLISVCAWLSNHEVNYEKRQKKRVEKLMWIKFRKRRKAYGLMLKATEAIKESEKADIEYSTAFNVYLGYKERSKDGI